MAGDKAGVTSLIVCILLVTHGLQVDGCYLRNCPIGGKRSISDQNDDPLIQWIDQIEPHAVSTDFNHLLLLILKSSD